MGTEGDPLDALAEGLWLRLRDVILAEQRLERFAFAPESPGPAGADRLALADAAAAGALARDVVLRALAAGSDPVGFRILERLAPGGAVPIAELARAIGLPALAAAERVHALSQAGLAARDLERDAACATPAGRGLWALVEAVGAETAGRLRRALPDLRAG